jgi:hypothetical protein
MFAWCVRYGGAPLAFVYVLRKNKNFAGKARLYLRILIVVPLQ